jgi:hypothetical protein
MAIRDDLALHLKTARLSDPLGREAGEVLLGLGGRFDDQVTSIAADENLSAAGRSNAMAGVRADLQAAVDGWRGEVLGPLDGTIEAQQKALAAAAAPAPMSELEALRLELRHGEIRRSLEGVDPLALRGSFDELPSSVQAALRDAPPRPVTTDAGGVAWVDVAPAVTAPTSPELQAAQGLRDTLGALATQLTALAGGDRQQARAEGRS